MATYIHFIGGSEVIVSDDHEKVVKAIAGSESGFVTFSRKAGYSDPGTYDGKPIHVLPASVAFVSPA